MPMDWNLIFPLDDYVGGISRYIPLLDTPTCLNHPKQQQQQQVTSNKQQATNNHILTFTQTVKGQTIPARKSGYIEQ